MSIVFLVIIGAAAGLIATKVLKIEMGLLPTVAVGVIGAVIGGVVLGALLKVAGLLAGLVGAVLGAFLVLYVLQRLF